MCILIQHYSNTNFSKEHFDDFYSRNPDGFGAIVNVNGQSKVIKSLGNVDTLWKLYSKHIRGREAVIHFRMKTHGEINLDNCHPYEVLPGLHMAHNGVLSSGNSADPKMSDTWHYIKDFLRPILERDPELLLVPAFQQMIGSHIGGSNKFAFMTKDGHVVVINKSAGINFLNAWLSNTYAWTPAKWGYYQNSYGNYGRANGPITYSAKDTPTYAYPYEKMYERKDKNGSLVKTYTSQANFEWHKRKVETSFVRSKLTQEESAKLFDQVLSVFRKAKTQKQMEDWVRGNRGTCTKFLIDQYSGVFTSIGEVANLGPKRTVEYISDTLSEHIADQYMQTQLSREI